MCLRERDNKREKELKKENKICAQTSKPYLVQAPPEKKTSVNQMKTRTARDNAVEYTHAEYTIFQTPGHKTREPPEITETAKQLEQVGQHIATGVGYSLQSSNSSTVTPTFTLALRRKEQSTELDAYPETRTRRETRK